MKVGREIPSRIGRYEVLRPLGSGGMATVWLARYRVVGSVHRQVAIKAMHPHLRGDPDWLDAFLREARLAATIQHPNVVSVEEVIDDPEGLFLVMEFVAGPTVAEILGSERELPPPIAGRLILDALEGLHAVHELADDRGRELGIVHRDFTPQNILVGGDGIGKLTDFGVAKMITEATTGSVKGKLGYMAPEQLAGKTLDRRADLWAAAVVTWELIAKRRMFGHRGQVAVVPQLTEEHFPLAQHHPSAPPALDELLKRALSPTRDERFATVQAMAQQLQRLWKRTWGIASHSDVAGWLSALPGAETYAYLATAVTDRGRPPAPTPLEAFGYGPRAAAALIAVGALMALGAFTVTRSPDVALATRLPVGDVVAAPPPLPASRSAEPEARRLVIVSDVPVIALSVGTHVVDLPRPQREIAVDRADGPLEVVARAEDGRSLEASLGANDDTLELTFGPAPRPAPRPRPPRPAPPPASKPPGLHPM